ncbi:MAG: hypothetical protein ACKPKO_23870, partial [Candidatus Fonsibacter sp.]
KPGHSPLLREILSKLKGNPDQGTILNVYRDHLATKYGYINTSLRCCPQCGDPLLAIQCICLYCGMHATFQGDIRAPLLTLEAMEEIERKAIEDIEGVAASPATTSPPTVQKPPGFVAAECFAPRVGKSCWYALCNTARWARHHYVHQMPKKY